MRKQKEIKRLDAFLQEEKDNPPDGVTIFHKSRRAHADFHNSLIDVVYENCGVRPKYCDYRGYFFVELEQFVSPVYSWLPDPPQTSNWAANIRGSFTTQVELHRGDSVIAFIQNIKKQQEALTRAQTLIDRAFYREGTSDAVFKEDK